jgi:ribosomal protein L16/L10AE
LDLLLQDQELQEFSSPEKDDGRGSFCLWHSLSLCFYPHQIYRQHELGSRLGDGHCRNSPLPQGVVALVRLSFSLFPFDMNVLI